MLFQLRDLGLHRPHLVGGRIDAIGRHLFVLELVTDRVPVDDLHHRIGHFGLERLAQIQHGLRALPVQLFDCRQVGCLDGCSKKLLKLRILLICRVS